jgi:hypothetical protein
MRTGPGSRGRPPLNRRSPIDVQAPDALLETTHNKKTPWVLVGCNDQRRGRLTLIRHLLDRIPERQVPQTMVEFPPLDHKPLQEQFGTPLRPIAAAD